LERLNGQLAPRISMDNPFPSLPSFLSGQDILMAINALVVDRWCRWVDGWMWM